MVALDMPDFMTDQKAYLGGIVTQCLKHVGIDHHEVSSAMPGGKGIEYAVSLKQIEGGKYSKA